MKVKGLFLVVVVLGAALAAHAQAPFGISAAELGSATAATVTYNSSTDSQSPSGASVIAWNCSVNCTVWDFPLMSTATRHVAIFAFGDWRIAAYCERETSTQNPYDISIYFQRSCEYASYSDKSWIELRKGGTDLSVLFEYCEKKHGVVSCKDPDDIEKNMRRRAASLYHILSVHNVKTNETWPKTLNDLMQK